MARWVILPSGLIDALHSTERVSIAVTGNSEFMIDEAELLISIHCDTPVLVACLDSQQFGAIHQPHCPDRVSDTQRQHSNFSEVANAFGAHGILVANNKGIAACDHKP